MRSEFGQGLTYCLGLFLCHSERDYNMPKRLNATKKEKEVLEIINRPDLWFYGAADHLYEMEIPETLSRRLKKRLAKFKDKVMGWRLVMDEKDKPTQEDKTWSINEAKDLLRLIDKHMGVKTKQGDWQ